MSETSSRQSTKHITIFCKLFETPSQKDHYNNSEHLTKIQDLRSQDLYLLAPENGSTNFPKMNFLWHQCQVLWQDRHLHIYFVWDLLIPFLPLYQQNFALSCLSKLVHTCLKMKGKSTQVSTLVCTCVKQKENSYGFACTFWNLKITAHQINLTSS